MLFLNMAEVSIFYQGWRLGCHPSKRYLNFHFYTQELQSITVDVELKIQGNVLQL